MNRQIALLGWGSLLWESRAEFDAWHGTWQNGGPLLKIEFSRISLSRAGALTLVIDAANGVETTVAYCFSVRPTLAEAIEDLRKREATTIRNIGFVRSCGEARYRDKPTRDPIASWAASHDIDDVVWTDLPGNFEEKVGETFTVGAAQAYLQRLEPEGKIQAIKYIRSSPVFVRTPLRDALAGYP